MTTDYKDTLNLPVTGFEMRAGLAQKEPKLLEQWQAAGLYERIQEARKDAPLFVLHDGPPYANGQIHQGHILNKILKDIVVKDRTMSGHRVPYVPGWDCHGLPIEVQVDKELGPKKAGMSKADIHAACRAYADKFVSIQRDQFKRLGVLGRWDEPYKTMSFGYEAQTLREFAKFAASGLLYKALRTVNWCSTHQTALAEAEVEYEDHTSPSVYVAFPLTKQPKGLTGDADLVIWTTTPWTLPANLAIALHPELEYVAYPVRGRTRLFAKGLAETFLAAIGEPAFDASKVLGTWVGKDLEGLTYRHVFIDRESPVVLGEHVTLEAGTGAVHTAPGHGADDFDVGKKYGLEILNPVDAAGRFTAEARVPALVGKKTFEGNPEIIQLLVDSGALLNKPTDTVRHRYAHCWRCHNPIITRATEQWWVAMDKPYAGGATLRERALASLKQVRWIPDWGEDRIHGMLAGRPDWCLSRQRTWGVPIAVAYCEGCNTPLVDPERMNRVADVFDKEGAAAWFVKPLEELMGPLSCNKCGGKSFRKEGDILDVWFDSGISYAAVVEREKLGHPTGAPVDLYLEGSDQHRGWFHSSLLCSLATRQHAPYRQVLTHGFVVDGEGKKISKSKGNFVDPFKTIAEQGAEILRLWVASEDYREDIRVSQEILTRLGDTYRKIRNTLRYLLGNVHDFDPARDLLPADKLLEVDRYALGLLHSASERSKKAFQHYEFHVVVQSLTELCTVDLSAFYLDMLKDRLYASRKDSRERRSAQTALYVMARDLIRLLAPILSFTSEEAWSFLPRLPGDPDSVHLALHPGQNEPAAITALWHGISASSHDVRERYGFVREVRRVVNAQLEEERRQKRIGSSVEAEVTLSAPDADYDKLVAFGPAALADLFIVSKVVLGRGAHIGVTVQKAPGTKCARCWLYREDVGANLEHGSLCRRCSEAV